MAANQTFREPYNSIPGPLPGDEGKTFRIVPMQQGLSLGAVYNAAGQIVPPGHLKVYIMGVEDAPRENKTLSPTDHQFIIHQYFNYRVTYNGQIIFDLIVAHHVEHYVK